MLYESEKEREGFLANLRYLLKQKINHLHEHPGL